MTRIVLLSSLGLFFTTILSADHFEFVTDEYLAKRATEDAESIKKLIGDDWTVSVEGGIITIESKFDIYHVAIMSRPSSPPPLDAGIERLRKEAFPKKYLIKLRYRKLIDEEEVIRRRNERQKHADVLNFGASGKTEWADAANAYLDIQVPRYRMGYHHIYRELYERPWIKVFPLDALKKVGAAKELLDTKFRRMRTGHD